MVMDCTRDGCQWSTRAGLQSGRRCGRSGVGIVAVATRQTLSRLLLPSRREAHLLRYTEVDSGESGRDPRDLIRFVENRGDVYVSYPPGGGGISRRVGPREGKRRLACVQTRLCQQEGRLKRFAGGITHLVGEEKKGRAYSVVGDRGRSGGSEKQRESKCG